MKGRRIGSVTASSSVRAQRGFAGVCFPPKPAVRFRPKSDIRRAAGFHLFGTIAYCVTSLSNRSKSFPTDRLTNQATILGPGPALWIDTLEPLPVGSIR